MNLMMIGTVCVGLAIATCLAALGEPIDDVRLKGIDRPRPAPGAMP